MCGIIGLMNPSGYLKPGLKDAFTQMLFADAIRGKDSTGVLLVRDNKIDWKKAAAPV